MKSEVESEMHAAWRDGDFKRSATLAIEHYGPEILSFLVATLRKEDDAAEVFADWTTDLWRGLPSFRWESSARTWLYVLARHRALRFRRNASRMASRAAGHAELETIAYRVRTDTLRFLRTDVKSRFTELRDELSPEEREPLILRIDRGLSWEEQGIDPRP